MNISSKITRFVTAALLVAVTLGGCDTIGISEDPQTYDGEALVKFDSDELSFTAQQETESFVIGVSTLKPIGRDRTYNFEVVDSLTTAVEGEDYELGANSFVIRADSTIAKIPITIFRESLGDQPTLHLRISAGNVASYNASVNIILKPFYPYDQQAWVGEYNLVYAWFYGDLNPRVVSISADSENENILIVENMFQGNQGTSFTFVLSNLNDPASRSIEFINEQAWYSTTYDTYVVMEGEGSFDQGTLSFQATAEHYIPGLGSFGESSFTLEKNQE